ncbi:MAG TPA: hypothetical protein VFG14_02225 [Chthoniobacteraceae bacterium]|jgi:hypothetical protein|nr:hypothetical protein [Chthoniobacteraceae bacterium]
MMVLCDRKLDRVAPRLWCAESGLEAPWDTADRDGCPYPHGRILEVRVEDGAVDAFVELWSGWIVSFGVR